MFWVLAGLKTEADQLIHDHVSGREILQLVGEQVQSDKCFITRIGEFSASGLDFLEEMSKEHTCLSCPRAYSEMEV